MERLKSKGNKKGYTLSNQTESSLNFNSIFAWNLSGEVQDHGPIGSTISKQEVQSTRTIILKM